MNVVSVWNPKGGQGKSLVSLNLAAAAHDMGIKPLVICTDPQGTSTKYGLAGNLPFSVISKIPDEKPDADLVIIDHQASDWTLPTPTLLLMPVKPCRDQYTTYAEARELAENGGKEIITIVTDAHTHRADERDVLENLVADGAFSIPASGAFSRSASDYRTIFDETMNKAYKVKERREEFRKILGAVLLNDNKKEG